MKTILPIVIPEKIFKTPYIIFYSAFFPIHIWVSSPFDLFDWVLLSESEYFYLFEGLVATALVEPTVNIDGNNSLADT